MFWNRSTKSVLAVVFACVLASCVADGPTNETVLGPDVVQPQTLPAAAADSSGLSRADSTLLANQGFYWIKAPTVERPRPRSLLRWLVQTVKATLSLDLDILGGVLELLGHTVLVPEGAVTRPTTFSITVLQTGLVEVDLNAVPKSLLARLLHIRRNESIQFNVPVTVSLSYEDATNVVDPSRLKIARVNPDGTYEILPSVVDTDAQTVTVELDHFSRYCMIAD